MLHKSNPSGCSVEDWGGGLLKAERLITFKSVKCSYEFISFGFGHNRKIENHVGAKFLSIKSISPVI